MRRWRVALLLAVATSLCGTHLSAQIGSGAMSSVNQGAAAATSDVNAWPIKVVFGGTHIDPRLVTIQNASLAVTGTFWQATQPVSGTFWQATQPVSLASLPSLATGANVIGAVTQSGTWNVGTLTSITNPVAVTGTFWQATQPISGTVTVTDGAGALNTIVDSGTLTAVTSITDAVTVTDGAGALNVICDSGCGSPGASNVISLSISESVAAPTAATWYLKRQWTVPATFTYTPTRVFAAVTTAGSRTQISVGNVLGTFNVSTNAFTDGDSVAAPRHYARLFACVTTALSAVATNVTVTYTDELGNTGNTTTALTIPASAPVGNCFEFQLAATTGQMRDGGVRDVTAVSDTAAPTGVFEIHGHNPLLDAQGAANAFEQSVEAFSQVTNPEHIDIMFFQAATTAQQRAATIAGGIR